MKPELISFKTCPYVQRSVIMLEHRQIDYDITYIDLSDPPEWFQQISPLNKVPLLRIGDDVLFESAVINEYLDETSGAELQPADALTRAVNRAWIEFSSDMLGNLYAMKMSTDAESYDRNRATLVGQLQRLEKRLGDGPWFNGERFSLADIGFAPFFRQDSVAQYRLSVIDPASMPKVDAWARRLLDLPEVRASVVEDFEELYLQGMRNNGSYSLRLLAA